MQTIPTTTPAVTSAAATPTFARSRGALHGRTAIRAFALLASATAIAGLAACGDDSEAATDDPITTEPATTQPGPTGTVSFAAVDYGFEDLPAEIAAGTRLSLTNTSEREVHEAVVFKLPEGEERSLTELVAASETDPAALGEFAGVLVAMPGEPGVEVEGPVVLDDAGRYAVVCFIPVGADPEVYRQAIETGTPPDVQGPPHASEGMVAELVVS